MKKWVIAFCDVLIPLKASYDLLGPIYALIIRPTYEGYSQTYCLNQ